jgi:hypothetical protein
MINLLPPETREHFLYARRNTGLVRWMLAFTLGIVGIGLVVGFGQLYIGNSIKTYTQQAEVTRAQLKEQKLDETQARVTEISSSLKLAVQVLSRQILFSKLIQQIGAAIPSGASLTDLRIAKLEGGIDLEFAATDYQTGTQVQVNLKDPANKIFDKADLVNINCSANAASDPVHPCQVIIRASFAKNNPFLFITPTSTGVKP